MAKQTVLGARAVAPGVKAQTQALVDKKLAGAKVTTVREWQQKWNEKHPEDKIKVDGVAGRQTLSAMGAWGPQGAVTQARAQGGGEGGAPNERAKAVRAISPVSSRSSSGRGGASWMNTGNVQPRKLNVRIPENALRRAGLRAKNPGYHTGGW